MNTKTNNKNVVKKMKTGVFYLLLLSFSPLLLFVSCSDWDDHYENLASQAGNDLTLWQTIQQHPELSDFRDVLSQTKVFKYHKVTDVSYADLLDGTQTFTVLAPVNGSFNKDSVLSLLSTNRGDSMVVRSFIGNHLSYNQVANVEKPTEFFLLNSKRATIGSIKNPSANTGYTGLIPGSGRPPGEANGNPLHYPCLGNPMDRGA